RSRFRWAVPIGLTSSNGSAWPVPGHTVRLLRHGAAPSQTRKHPQSKANHGCFSTCGESVILGLVRAKRAVARNAAGHLECEVCGFVAQTAYPEYLSGELCEVHHRAPLGELGAAPAETRLEDLAILCPNCHRAIHQTRPMMTVEEFRARFRTRPVY